MIKATQAHAEFRRRIQRYGADYNARLSVPSVDSILTEAYQIWFENMAKVAEFDANVRVDLRLLEIKGKCFSCKNTSNGYVQVAYPDSLYRPLRITAKASKEPCGPRELIVHMKRTQELSEALKSPNWKPSYEFEETIADEGSEGLLVYHNDEFKIDKVCIDYLKKPEAIHCPSLAGGAYTDGNGELVTKDKGIAVSNAFQSRKIVDIAVLIALRDLSSFPEYESQLKKILETDKLYLT